MNDSDLEVSELLEEALGAPPVPASLLERLDKAVEAEWGESPQLTAMRPTTSVWQRMGVVKSRLVGWPLAACLSLAVVAALLLRGNSDALAWSDVLESISKQSLVQLTNHNSDPAGSWMSVPVRTVGYSGYSDQQCQLVDFRRGFALQRDRTEPTIHRVALRSDSQTQQLERVVLHFLIASEGFQLTDPVPDRRVVSEECSRVNDQVELRLTVEERVQQDVQGDTSARSVRVILTLDDNTKLPSAYRLEGAEFGDRLRFVKYSNESTDTWVSKNFPNDLPIVDAAVTLAQGARRPTGAAVPPDASDPGGGTQIAVADGGSPRVPVDSPNAPSTPAPQGPNDPDQPDPPNGNPQDPGAVLVAPVGAASLAWTPLRVRAMKPQEVVAQSDQILAKLWNDFDVTPAPIAKEQEILRRVYLDLVGRPPSVNESRSYFRDTSPSRYENLVDRLLNSRDHATHLATTWRRFLLPEGVDLSDFGGIEQFDRWLADQFGRNQPYSETVSELLLAEGRLSRSGPLLFYSAAKLDADQLASRSARVFLGMRLECAQCHDDPFEPWTQKDFWSYAAFFARISRPQAELETVSTVMRVRDIDRGEVMLPDTETVVSPHFLDGRAFQEEKDRSRRQQLTQWLVSKQNPYFARATVNRLWAQLFGRGIVDPVDGFGKVNEPVSPELLDLLAGQFIQSQFDLRELFRTIVLTKAYRLSSGADANHEQAEERHRLFAQMNIKMLTAEQMYDGIAVASMLGSDGDVQIQRMGNSSRDAFLVQFRTPGGLSTNYQGGIPQALTLMNGGLIQGATGLRTSGLLESLNAPFYSNEQRIEVIYLATLSRKPSPAEWKILNQYLEDGGDSERDEILADVLWALLNSAEFTMNH